MAKRVFTDDERAYLETLDAVDHVSATRIAYSEEFRLRVAEGYARGESPTRMFREAGLDPKLVGYKRIERAIARWSTTPTPSVRESAREDAKSRMIAEQKRLIIRLERELAELKERGDGGTV